jgi:hypothetical protein
VFECRYGGANCLCDGTTWVCSDPECIDPTPMFYTPICLSLAHFTCQYPDEGQTCMCGDRNGGPHCSCPTARPVEGNACVGPVGPEFAGCTYGDRVCDCIQNRWTCSVCPVAMPVNATSCPFVANCSYPAGFCYCDGTAWTCS